MTKISQFYFHELKTHCERFKVADRSTVNHKVSITKSLSCFTVDFTLNETIMYLKLIIETMN